MLGNAEAAAAVSDKAMGALVCIDCTYVNAHKAADFSAIECSNFEYKLC